MFDFIVKRHHLKLIVSFNILTKCRLQSLNGRAKFCNPLFDRDTGYFNFITHDSLSTSRFCSNKLSRRDSKEEILPSRELISSSSTSIWRSEERRVGKE